MSTFRVIVHPAVSACKSSFQLKIYIYQINESGILIHTDSLIIETILFFKYISSIMECVFNFYLCSYPTFSWIILPTFLAHKLALQNDFCVDNILKRSIPLLVDLIRTSETCLEITAGWLSMGSKCISAHLLNNPYRSQNYYKVSRHALGICLDRLGPRKIACSLISTVQTYM